MERTIYKAFDQFNYMSLSVLNDVEGYMSKEELSQMREKMQSLMNNLLGIPDVQTRALMEQMFKRGYLAAIMTQEQKDLSFNGCLDFKDRKWLTR